MVLTAGHMNRLPEARRAPFRRMFLYCSGIMLVMTMVVVLEYTNRILLHSALPYILVCGITPIILAVGSRVTRFRFAATYIAGFYLLFNWALILILPLFPAQPKLGPVYQNVTHFIPQEFPLLLIVPAFCLDLFWQRAKNWNPWSIAVASAAIYVAVLVAVEWPFASFLMSPASRNAIFGTTYFWYGLPPTSFTARSQFLPSAGPLRFAFGLLLAFLFSTVAARWGWSRGQWFRDIKR
jgi:hypothetical protein